MIVKELSPEGLERLISIPEVPGYTYDQFLGNKKKRKEKELGVAWLKSGIEALRKWRQEA